MKLVRAASGPVKLSEVVNTHSWGESGLILAHSDGTVTAIDENQKVAWIWLNPGKRLINLTSLDDHVLICFSDQSCRTFSLLTGFETISAEFPEEITNIAVFETFLVGWNKHSINLHFIHRFNLQIFQPVIVDSFVKQIVGMSDAIIVVCSSDVYRLTSSQTTPVTFKLSLLAHFNDVLLIGASRCGENLCLVTPHSCKLMPVRDSQPLVEEITINSPTEAMFSNVYSLHDHIVLNCSDNQFVVLKNNNIQVLTSPVSSGVHCVGLTNNSYLVSSDINLYRLSMNNNELQWSETSLNIGLADRAWLRGETDSNVSAVFGSWKGRDDGSINGVTVFPSAVLKVTNDCAYSRHGRVQLPLRPVNVIHKLSDVNLVDARVSIQLSEIVKSVAGDSLLGIEHPDGSICLHPSSISRIRSPISALLVSHEISAYPDIVDKTDLSPLGIQSLEDLAVIAQDAKDSELLRVTAQFLENAWDQQHVNDLFKRADCRSLKVLASLSNYLSIDLPRLSASIKRKLSTTSPAECEAILWIFEQQHDVVDLTTIPFQALQHVSSESIQRFASIMATHSAEKLLDNVSSVLTESTLARTHEPSNISVISVESLATNLLLRSIQIGETDVFPANEEQLVRIVDTVIPATHRRVPGAKDILVKLIASHKLFYHKRTQRLLVALTQRPDISGIVFDMSNEGCEQFKLSRPGGAQISDMNFGGDGKRVIGVSAQLKFSWTLTRGIQALFGASSYAIEAVEFR